MGIFRFWFEIIDILIIIGSILTELWSIVISNFEFLMSSVWRTMADNSINQLIGSHLNIQTDVDVMFVQRLPLPPLKPHLLLLLLLLLLFLTIYFFFLLKWNCNSWFDFRLRIEWLKDHVPLVKSHKYDLNKKGMLRIQDVTYSDSGVYSCIGINSNSIRINRIHLTAKIELIKNIYSSIYNLIYYCYLY